MADQSTANTTPDVNKNDEWLNDAYKNFKKDVTTLQFSNTQERNLKQDVQLDRLTTQKFRTPYEVLLLEISASDQEIKKQYRQFSLIVHPDRCKDDRAKDAFYVVEQAYKTLQDEQKKAVYVRMMKAAIEKTEQERAIENRKREKNGQPPLPQDTFQADYKENLSKIVDDIEERKIRKAQLRESEKKQKQEEIETKGLMNQYKVLTEEEWEGTREKRVSNWRTFTKKKGIIGTKKSNKGIKAPSVKQEERPAHAPKIDNTGKILGIDEDYKKKWK